MMYSSHAVLITDTNRCDSPPKFQFVLDYSVNRVVRDTSTRDSRDRSMTHSMKI